MLKKYITGYYSKIVDITFVPVKFSCSNYSQESAISFWDDLRSSLNVEAKVQIEN
jgi:hypothetical protein